MSEIFVKLRIKEILKGNMKRYLLFGFVEIFLVGAGILIALAINNWNIRKSQRNDELHIYGALKERIQEDKRIILLISIMEEKNEVYHSTLQQIDDLTEKIEKEMARK